MKDFLNLKEKVEDYFKNVSKKHQNMIYYLNIFSDNYNQFLNSKNRNNTDFYSIFENNSKINSIDSIDYTFKNNEMNILTNILIKEKFNGNLLKYLLTAINILK